MEYKIMGGSYKLRDYDLTIDDFIKADNNQNREQLFKTIAEDILKKEKFKKIYSPDMSQSVPFDFLACKDNKLALIELKGREKGFNYSKPTQYSRLQQVLVELNKERILYSPFLIQINLEFEVYQILTKEFYDMIFVGLKKVIETHPELGKKQKIKSSMDTITEYRKSHKC